MSLYNGLDLRGWKSGAGDEEVVHRPAALPTEHLQPEHVDAVLGEVTCHRRQAPRPVAQPQPHEPRPVRGAALRNGYERGLALERCRHHAGTECPTSWS